MHHTSINANGIFSLSLFALAVLGLTGCSSHQIKLDPDQDLISKCDGTFKYQGPVRLTGPTQPRYEVSINLSKSFSDNVDAAAVPTPNSRRVTAGSPGYQYKIIGGKLADACLDGKIDIYASGSRTFPTPPNWTSPSADFQKFTVKANSVKAAAPGGVTPTGQAAGAALITPAGNGYRATVECCAGAAPGNYAISTTGSRNMTNMGVAPAVIACPAAAPIRLTITGSLDTPSLSGQVNLTIRGPNSTCRLTTEVEPAAP